VHKDLQNVINVRRRGVRVSVIIAHYCSPASLRVGEYDAALNIHHVHEDFKRIVNVDDTVSVDIATATWGVERDWGCVWCGRGDMYWRLVWYDFGLFGGGCGGVEGFGFVGIHVIKPVF